MDWMRLCDGKKSSSFKNNKPLQKIDKVELKKHNMQSDCWTAYNGKVYNITQYLDYHPGGITILMQGAGKDCTNLFNKYHRWINIDNMLSTCLVGELTGDIDEDIEEIINESKYDSKVADHDTTSPSSCRTHSPDSIDNIDLGATEICKDVLGRAVELLNLESDDDD